VAAHALLEGDKVFLRGLVATIDGSTILKGEIRGEAADARKLGLALAEDLIGKGAGKILRDLEDAG